MSNVYASIFTYLLNDTVLVGVQQFPPNGSYSGILTGGLWNRPLKRPGPNGVVTAGSTPAAFGNTAPEAGRIRYAASIVDRGDIRHFQDQSIPSAIQEAVAIYFYAPAHESGKQAIRNAVDRVYSLLRDYRFLTDAGVYARVFFDTRYGIVDSEEFLGAVVDYCTYTIVTRKGAFV